MKIPATFARRAFKNENVKTDVDPERVLRREGRKNEVTISTVDRAVVLYRVYMRTFHE